MTHATSAIINPSNDFVDALVVDLVEATLDSLKPTLSSSIDSFTTMKTVIDTQAKPLAKIKLKQLMDQLYDAAYAAIDDTAIDLTKATFTSEGVSKIEYLVNLTSRSS